MNLRKKILVIGIIGALAGLTAWSQGMACSGPPDAMFIDGMIIHHHASIRMAEQALKESSRPEITDLAKEIIVSGKRELEQLNGWFKAWYPGSAPTGGMGVDMGSMEIESNTTKPFDLRFIEAMIPLQKGCIAMAKKALRSAHHEEITSFATDTITSQEPRLEQLQQWKKDWFGK